MPDSTTNKEAAVRIAGLGKVYPAEGKSPARMALRDIDLVIPTGSVFGLLGPNGAGKSTLINILSGMTRKTAGSVEIAGFDIDSRRRQASNRLGVVSQELSIDPFFTPRESLDLLAGFFGIRKAHRHTDAILEMVGLADRADAYVRQLSGGMKRRLMVAKAMVHSPSVLILDEPTAGVDVELRRQLWDTIARLHASGVTVILTTHYLAEAEQLCDTIAIIDHGAVVACEPTPRLLERLDHKTLRVTPCAPLQQVPEGLAKLGALLTEDGGLAISYRRGETGVEELLARVHEADIRILDLATEEPDLEDVFVALTS